MFYFVYVSIEKQSNSKTQLGESSSTVVGVMVGVSGAEVLSDISNNYR